MTYDFDKVIDRRGTDCFKWDILKPGELPMWVADMDFEAAPPIRQAIENKVKQGVFGYSYLPDRWYQAYIDWWKTRHGFTMEKDWLIFSTGVVPTMSSVVRKLTTPGEKVVFLTPVYNIFYNSVVNNGRIVTESELIRKPDGTYDIDWPDLEARLSDPQTTMFFLCNPQNPVGRIWTREELARIGDLAKINHVIVVSDEIHCDLTDPATAYIPFASASETCREVSITCLAPTKCFNIAGLHTSAISVPDPYLRHKVDRGLNTDECAEPNVFAVDVAVAAFNECGDWLDQLRAYVAGNKAYVRDFIEKEIPELSVASGPATYLLWIDGRKLKEMGYGLKLKAMAEGLTDDQSHNYGSKAPLADYIRAKTGLFLSNGEQYGKGGSYYLRMNLACPRSFVEDGVQRLKKAVEAWKQECC
jgi:cystathionine beta-lyase